MNLTLTIIGLVVVGVIALVILAVVINVQNKQAGLDQTELRIQDTGAPRDLGSVNIPPGSSSLEIQLLELLRQGKKIEAIKVYRDATGKRLKEAKETVEALEMGNPLPGSNQPAPAQSATVLDLLRAGNRLEAIWLYQEVVGCSMDEAKEAVAAMERRL